MEEGTVVKWLKKEGDKVHEGDILAEIETDKATMEFESFHSGMLLYIGIQEGESALVDSVLAIIGEKGVDVKKLLASVGDSDNSNSSNDSSESQSIPEKTSETEKIPESKSVLVPKVLETATTKQIGRTLASPLAKKIAEEKGIDLRYVKGTGDNGRIIKRDIETFVPASLDFGTSLSVKVSEGIEVLENSQMRKVIARRLSESKFSAPHYYLTIEVDMDSCMAFRSQANQPENIKISFNDIVLKACAKGLKAHPNVNSSWKDKTTEVYKHVHLGVAVAVDGGLLVPVIKFADSLSLVEIDLLSRRGLGGIASQTSVGAVNGETIPIDEFRSRVQNLLDNYKASNISITNKQAVDFAWNDVLREKILLMEIQTLGIELDHSKVYELATPMFSNSPLFKDEKGNYAPEKVKEYIKDLKITNPETYQNWKIQEQKLLTNGKVNLYNTMVKAGLNATKIQGKYRYNEETDRVSIDYVKIPYSSIPDSLIDISDNEIHTYIETHTRDYKQENERDLQYVVFKEKPSKTDIEAIKVQLRKYLSPFEEYNYTSSQTEQIPAFPEIDDNRSYINMYSDRPYSDKYLFVSDLPVAFREQLFALKKGVVFGPYEDNGYMKISKLVSRKIVADSVKSAHIIVPFQGAKLAPEGAKTKDMAKKTIDSIFQLVKNNKKKFKEVATEINTDATKSKGGDIGWVRYSQISDDTFDKKFSDYIFFNSVGSMGVVETAFGYHIIRVDQKEAKQMAVQLASISIKIVPSETTINEIFAKSTKFEMDVSNGIVSFEDVAKRDSLEVFRVNNLKILDESLGSLGSQRGIVQWAFNEDTEESDIKHFNVHNDNVIVRLVNIRKEGLQSVDKARFTVMPILLKEKKAKMIAEKYKGKNISDLSEETPFPIKKASNISMKSLSIKGIGREPELLGVVFATKQGEESRFISGSSGVFKAKVTLKTKGSQIEDFFSYEVLQRNAYDLRKNNIFSILKDLYDIEDDRHIFY
ncbi:peptidylprolyl isomerase [Elysia marginata]|uniref:Dihydrolipoamide acetyltransferase component of pyruvate dehydrogenase complex n=1 Tax=Elysia marginata TaxID=1093978 RepID=A0AAV4G4Z6_9GAST|nr:peptidylprolyl isomerase [Elysia marginata]